MADRLTDWQTVRQAGGAAHGAHATSPLIGIKALISLGFFAGYAQSSNTTYKWVARGGGKGMHSATAAAVVVFIIKSPQTGRGLLKEEQIPLRESQ